jgi:hypothetical protein
LWEGSVSFKYRVEDPRLGRFFSVDPLFSSYPANSNYAFSENDVIANVEQEGLEKRKHDSGAYPCPNPENGNKIDRVRTNKRPWIVLVTVVEVLPPSNRAIDINDRRNRVSNRQWNNVRNGVIINFTSNLIPDQLIVAMNGNQVLNTGMISTDADGDGIQESPFNSTLRGNGDYNFMVIPSVPPPPFVSTIYSLSVTEAAQEIVTTKSYYLFGILRIRRNVKTQVRDLTRLPERPSGIITNDRKELPYYSKGRQNRRKEAKEFRKESRKNRG